MSDPAQAARVAVIVLNWNGLEDTRACAHSLLRQTYSAASVYLVDNASNNNEAAQLAREFPQFTHLANRENQGFTGGNNAAINRALADGADYVLLLNNDTEVAPDFLAPLVAAAQADPSVGMAGPKILFHARPDVLWFAGGTIDWGAWPLFAHVGEEERDAGQHDAGGVTEFLSGCCLLARADAVRQIGLLDPSYGYYCEDVDWGLRARRAGWRLVYVPASRVWHKIGRSTERSAAAKPLYYQHRNPWLLARRHKGAIRALPVLMRTLWTALIYPVPAGGGGERIKGVILDAARDALLGRTGTHALAHSSRTGRGAARLLRWPTRAYWSLNAAARRRGGASPARGA